MLASHRRAIRDISVCRTQVLGGEVYLCNFCNEYRYSYHSCKNRHCPKCGNDQATQWLKKQFERLLPVTHFLVTFTLPSELRTLARSNQKILYGMLMDSAAAALQKLAWDPRWVGGLLGIVSVLQTWTRDLHYHPHVHMIVTGGGLTHDKKFFWRSSPNFLVPSAALAKIFRAKFRDRLKRALPGTYVPPEVWRKRWVLDIKPVDSGHAAFRYLAPYIFRVALSNKRILAFQDGIVTFRYKDGKSGKNQTRSLPAEQFISRFLQHVLPSRFRKVRYYGIFSPQRKKLLRAARALLPPVLTHALLMLQPQPAKHLCPTCQQPMLLLDRLPAQKYNQLVAIRAP